MATSPYLSTLTPLRGIAALLVLIFHITCYLVPLTAPGQTELISMGWLWVDFFFILSGFILCHVYSDLFKEGVSRAGYRRFMLARFARVYPLHVVTLCMTVLLVVLIHYLARGTMVNLKWAFDLEAIPASLLLLQSMGLYPAAPLNGPSWSLSTEWWVYLIFPFLVSAFMRPNPWTNAGIFVGVVAGYLVLMYWVSPQWGNRFTAEIGFPTKPTINLTADFGFFRCLAGFLLGMLLYEEYRKQTGFPLLRKGWVFVALFAGVLAGMHFGIHELVIVAFFPFIILSAAYNTDWLKRILDTSPLQRLGDWSFSIYLVHIPLIYAGYCLMLLDNPKRLSNISEFGYFQTGYGQAWLYCLVVVGATLLASALLYRFVEVPARNLLISRGKATAQETVAAT